MNIEHFPKRIKDFIKENLEEKLSLDLYSKQVEEIEFKARSGFIPFSGNKGGFRAIGFTDLNYFWGSGNMVAHRDARNEIERQIEYSLDLVRDDIFEKYQEYFDENKITKDKVNHTDLSDLYHKATNDKTLVEILTDFEEREVSYLSDEQSSIMFETRFLYHGYENGVHSASISAAVNTEGPYHRSHISWSPNTFCEGVKEIKIKWKNEKEFKEKFKKALEKCIKVTF
jgi:hypothetical protein